MPVEMEDTIIPTSKHDSPTILYLDAAQIKSLKFLGVELDRELSSLAREALTDLLKKYQPIILNQVIRGGQEEKTRIARRGKLSFSLKHESLNEK